MKTHGSIFTFILAVILALAAGTATQAQAQVAWSAIASSCVVQTGGQNLAYLNAEYGTLSFAPTKHGDIKVSCPVPFLNGQYPYADELSITFYDDHGFDGGTNHCYILADLLRSDLTLERGWDLATVAAANQSFTGRQVLSAVLSETMDFQSDYYWVDIQLHRDSSKATCNPTLVGTFLNNIIQ